jgi:hypothetical protein
LPLWTQRLHSLLPYLQSTHHENPEHAVAVGDPRAVHAPQLNCWLMSKSEVLQCKALTNLNKEANKLQESEDARHATDDGDHWTLPPSHSVCRALKLNLNRAWGPVHGLR